MKKTRIDHIIIAFMLCCAPAALFAEEIGINGSVKTDIRIRFDDQEITWNDTRATLKLEGSPSEKFHYYAEGQIKGIYDVSADDQFQSAADLLEGYLDLYKFISDRLDVRIGKQIVAWGTADKINPTSNVSPDDLEDPFDFGKKLGVNAVQATLYFGNVSLTGIFVPESGVAQLPVSGSAQALAGTQTAPEGMTIGNITQHIIEPEPTLSESSAYALKIATILWDYDVSLSYFAGRDDLPLANNIVLTPVDNLGAMDMDVDLVYPKMQVIGADVAGQLFTVGVWAEGALFLQEKVALTTALNTAEELLPQTSGVAMDDDPYFKYVIGLDYTFKNEWYINAQFIHGFFQERSQEALSDYIVFRAEKDFMNAELTIAPFGVAFVVPDWSEVSSNYGVIGIPEVTYRPVDNVELILGAYLMAGEGQNMFSSMADQDQLYFKAKVSF